MQLTYFFFVLLLLNKIPNCHVSSLKSIHFSSQEKRLPLNCCFCVNMAPKFESWTAQKRKPYLPWGKLDALGRLASAALHVIVLQAFQPKQEIFSTAQYRHTFNAPTRRQLCASTAFTGKEPIPYTNLQNTIICSSHGPSLLFTSTKIN